MTDLGVKVGEGKPLAPGVGSPGGGGSGSGGLHIEGDVGVEGPAVDLSAGLHLETNLNGNINAGGVNTQTYSIVIAVNDVPEDPTFLPHTKEIPLSEDPNDQPENGIIAVFAAIDPDTGKPADDVRLVNIPITAFVILSTLQRGLRKAAK